MPLPRHRIVVVDDTRAALYTLARLLETMGQHLLTADNAATALELIHSERPDLVISDLAMPNMNGYELAQRVREDPVIAEHGARGFDRLRPGEQPAAGAGGGF